MQADDVLPCGYKLLCPPMYALAIMGRDNCNIAPFMEHTKCKLSCTVKGDFFPGTEDHVITMQALTDEALSQGVQMVVQTLQEVPPQGHNGEYRLRIIAPQKAASFVIGRSGENLKEMQRKTGMKVAVDSKTWCGVGPEADQVVTLSGKLEGMQAAVSTTMDHMKQLKGETWFRPWIGRQNAERVAEANLPGGMAGGMMGGNMGGCQGNMGMPNMGGMGGCPGGMGMGNMGAMPMDMSGMGNMGMGNGMGMGNMGMGNMGMMGGMGGMDSAMGVGNGMGGTPGTLGDSSVEILQNALNMIPPQVSEDPRGFSLRCAVPSRLVSGLMGKGGGIAKEVRDMTGARIDIPNNPNDPDSRAMSITGPLYSTVAAYIYMMKQYLEIEAADGGGNGHAMNTGMSPMGPMGMNMGMGMNPMMNGPTSPLCLQALGQMEQQLTMQLQQVKQMKEQLAVIEAGGGQQ